MKIKCLLLATLILTVSSIGFDQSKPKADYVGSWSNDRGNIQMDISATKIVIMQSQKTAQTYKFRDVTGTGGTTYYFQITSLVRNSSFAKFLSISISKETKPAQMILTDYKSLADMKAHKNPQFEQTWSRDYETGRLEVPPFTDLTFNLLAVR